MKQPMLLHFCPDEKFICFVQDSFESALPGQNRFVVWCNSEMQQRPDGYARQSPSTRFASSSYAFSMELSRDLEWCDALIIHCMSPVSALAALRVPDRVQVIWSGWGFDYYHLIDLPYGGVLEGTRRLSSKAAALARKRLNISRIVRSLRWRCETWFFRHYLEKRILYRTNFFSAPIENDWKLLRSMCPDLRAKYTQINYGSVDSMFRVGPDRVKGDNILIGNSASDTNNHVEAFDVVSKIRLGKRRIIVPLSYGNADYTKSIIEYGRCVFGDAFDPLVEYMSLEKYNAIIASCSVVVMNHVRQQALGNVNIMLYKGARVFLRSDNPIYSFFRDKGAHIFSIDDLIRMQEDAFVPLDSGAIALNRRIIDEVWGHDSVRANILKLAERVSALSEPKRKS